MDCARSAVRLGAASVTMAYRRSREMMRASAKEVEAARSEGIAFLFNKVPAMIEGESRVSGMRFASEGPAEAIACDLVILALGQVAGHPACMERLGISTDETGRFLVDDQGRTSHPKFFAGGENANGSDLVVTAVAAGRKAGRQIAAAITASRDGNSSDR